MKKILIGLSLILFFTTACKEKEITSVSNEAIQPKLLDEAPVEKINLSGPFTQRISEISGLTWYKNKLILLPQFPVKFKYKNGGTLYSIPKSKIEDFLFSKTINTIEPDRIEFVAKGLEKYNRKDSGYESIVFLGDTAYLTIEYVNNGATESLIVKGILDSTANRLTLDSSSVRHSPAPDQFHNWSTETVLTFNNYIYTIFEVNGKNLVPNPKAYKFNSKLDFISTLNFPTIEYRVTDATLPDKNGKFWVINYLYPGDKPAINPTEDLLISRYGIGRTHLEAEEVERLVELKIENGAITITGRAPVYFQLETGKSSRNWEGIARLGNKGFLIATDKHPETILAFVPVKDLN